MITDIGYIGYFLLLIGLMNCIILLTPKLVSDLNISSEILFSASKAHFPIILLSFLCLIVTFVVEDYSLDYVAKNSNSNLPFNYSDSRIYLSTYQPLYLSIYPSLNRANYVAV